jgi:hypothetical protein
LSQSQRKIWRALAQLVIAEFLAAKITNRHAAFESGKNASSSMIEAARVHAGKTFKN